MNITTLMNNIRNAVYDNAALSAWCTSAYGQAHKVYVGVDTRNPPASSAYPLIHLFPLTKTAGGGNQSISIGATCGIYDANTLTVAGRTRAIELRGVSYLEAFRKLVETAALTAALDDGYWFDRIEMTYETVEYFPYFLAAMEIVVLGELAFTEDFFE